MTFTYMAQTNRTQADILYWNPINGIFHPNVYHCVADGQTERRSNVQCFSLDEMTELGVEEVDHIKDLFH